MVKKTSILKDSVREILLTKKRFLSLLLILMLGVGFYVGLNSTSLDMKVTAKKYYKDTNLMDLKVTSSMDLSVDDINEIKKINGIKGISAVKTLDTLVNINNKNYVIRVNSINNNRDKNNEDYINRLILSNGKYPSTVNEGLVEEKFLSDNNLVIGDLITLKPEDDTDLRAKKIKIVGTVKSSYYSSNDRGSSLLKGGKINYYMYLEENDFNSKDYSEVFLTINKANKLDTYSNKYKTYVNSYKNQILKIIADSTNEKYKVALEENKSNVEHLENSLNELYNSEVPQESLNDSIKDASENLKLAKDKLNKIKSPTANVTSRVEIPSFYEYKLETERIKNISKIFPLIFFIVAALVSLTSMTRMVDEERVQLGTLRAMGYSKFDVVFKYLLYAFLASFGGSLLGSLLFYKFIPKIISACYKMFYDMPNIITIFQFKYVILSTMLGVVITLLATIIVFFKDMLETPAMLMRQKSPKTGKRIFLEKINYLWSKLNFSNKVTFRNIFRYKKRLLMTVFGICGCTSLLLTSFGLKDSIIGIVNKQFSKINKYDMAININETLSNEDINELSKEINKNIKKMILINKTTSSIKFNKESEIINLIIPKNTNKINDFISINNIKNNRSLKVNNKGIIITKKLKNILNVKIGDKVEMTTSSNKKIKVKIIGITKNYIDHYVYMSPYVYEKLTKDNINYNTILVVNKNLNNKASNKLVNNILKNNNVNSCTLTNTTKKNYKNMLSTLNYVTLILIISAATLAFVVLYNLSSVNISERRKELATLKVLGFYDEEVTNYIHKETLILTILGALLGLIFGSFLTYYVIKICETNMFMFDFNIRLISYIFSFIITILFSFIVNIIMHFDLKKLDMAESLKSFE